MLTIIVNSTYISIEYTAYWWPLLRIIIQIICKREINTINLLWKEINRSYIRAILSNFAQKSQKIDLKKENETIADYTLFWRNYMCHFNCQWINGKTHNNSTKEYSCSKDLIFYLFVAEHPSCSHRQCCFRRGYPLLTANLRYFNTDTTFGDSVKMKLLKLIKDFLWILEFCFFFFSNFYSQLYFMIFSIHDFY